MESRKKISISSSLVRTDEGFGLLRVATPKFLLKNSKELEGKKHYFDVYLYPPFNVSMTTMTIDPIPCDAVIYAQDQMVSYEKVENLACKFKYIISLFYK